LSTNILSIDDSISASANTIAFGNNATYTYTGSGTIIAGDIIYQIDNENEIFANAVVQEVYANTILNETYIDIIRDTGIFRTNKQFINQRTDLSYNITKMSNTTVGVIDIVNTFYNNANTYGLSSETYSPITSFSFETKASFDILSLNNLAEYINFYSNDLISEYGLGDKYQDLKQKYSKIFGALGIK
jgi:hypothetical protein